MQRRQPDNSEAFARIRVRFAFFLHLATYVVVIGGLAGLNMLTDSRKLWFVWPALAWGIGLAVHAVNVFLTPAAPSSEREFSPARSTSRQRR